MSEFKQSNYGKGTAHQGEVINIGLSAEDVTQIIQAIDQLKKECPKELQDYLQQIKNAKTQEEKNSLALRTLGFIRERGWAIFDSLLAGVILTLAKGN